MFATSPSEVKVTATLGFFSGASKSPVKTPDTTPSLAKPLNILVVDDQLTNRNLLIRKLAGHSCMPATDGAEAVKAVEEAKDPFDLILMDLEMPNKDGKAAAREIRKLGYKTPIVCFSSTVTDEKGLAAINTEIGGAIQGMNDFISKPLNAVDLKRIIEKYSLTVSSPQAVTPFWSTTAPIAIPKIRAAIPDLGSFGIAPMSPTEGESISLLSDKFVTIPSLVS